MIAAIEPTVFIVIAVFVLTFMGVAWGLKTRQGSGINEHPGSDAADSVAGGGTGTQRQEDNLLDQHGKK